MKCVDNLNMSRRRYISNEVCELLSLTGSERRAKED